MNEHVKSVWKNQMERVSTALRKNRMEVYFADNREEVAEIVKGLIPQGASIGLGGSETLNECNLFPLIKSEDYRLIDRYAPGLTREQALQKQVEALSADVFLTGTNAITENGELYNVDGNGNRVAAIAFGPKSVIVVAGVNKIVRDIPAAVKRVKEMAAPANTKRLSMQTYCREKGECVSLSRTAYPCDGCFSESRICCQYLISAYQRHPGRIKVILVAEPLGF